MSNIPTSKELQEMQARCDKATKDWTYWGGKIQHLCDPDPDYGIKDGSTDAWFPRIAVLFGKDRKAETEANADFAMHARVDMPRLIALVERYLDLIDCTPKLIPCNNCGDKSPVVEQKGREYIAMCNRQQPPITNEDWRGCFRGYFKTEKEAVLDWNKENSYDCRRNSFKWKSRLDVRQHPLGTRFRSKTTGHIVKLIWNVEKQQTLMYDEGSYCSVDTPKKPILSRNGYTLEELGLEKDWEEYVS